VSLHVDEDIIAYMTNIDLTKPQTQRLIDAGKKALAAAGCPHVEVEIWHHADLSTHVVTGPLLYNWFWESGASVLERYETYFDVQLSREGLAYQLHNPFSGFSAASFSNLMQTQRKVCWGRF